MTIIKKIRFFYNIHSKCKNKRKLQIYSLTICCLLFGFSTLLINLLRHSERYNYTNSSHIDSTFCILKQTESLDDIYRSCINQCGYLKRINAYTTEMQLFCLKDCNSDLKKRQKLNEIKNNECKTFLDIQRYLSDYEKDRQHLTTRQDIDFFEKLKSNSKDKFSTKDGLNIQKKIDEILLVLNDIKNTKIQEDYLINQTEVQSNVITNYFLFRDHFYNALNNKKILSKAIQAFLLSEIEKVKISEPKIQKCPEKIEYTLTNESMFNIKYIKFGVPDFKDYRLTELVDLREDYNYELDKNMSAPSFIFEGDNRNKKVKLIDRAGKFMSGNLSSSVKMGGTYRKAYDRFLVSDNIIKYDLKDEKESYCFIYKNPIVREILFTTELEGSFSYKECDREQYCRIEREKVIDIYNLTEFNKTEKKLKEELRYKQQHNLDYNINILDFYKRNNSLFTLDILINIFSKVENSNLSFAELKKQVQNVFKEKTNLDIFKVNAILANNYLDFEVDNVSFHKLLNILNEREVKNIYIDKFLKDMRNTKLD